MRLDSTTYERVRGESFHEEEILRQENRRHKVWNIIGDRLFHSGFYQEVRRYIFPTISTIYKYYYKMICIYIFVFSSLPVEDFEQSIDTIMKRTFYHLLILNTLSARNTLGICSVQELFIVLVTFYILLSVEIR